MGIIPPRRLTARDKAMAAKKKFNEIDSSAQVFIPPLSELDLQLIAIREEIGIVPEPVIPESELRAFDALGIERPTKKKRVIPTRSTLPPSRTIREGFDNPFAKIIKWFKK